MNLKNLERRVNLLCPTCGGDDFETQEGAGQGVELLQCSCCGRQITRDDLIQENSETIEMAVHETSKQVEKDMAKELKNQLKKAFRGSKYIKIR